MLNECSRCFRVNITICISSQYVCFIHNVTNYILGFTFNSNSEWFYWVVAILTYNYCNGLVTCLGFTLFFNRWWKTGYNCQVVKRQFLKGGNILSKSLFPFWLGIIVHKYDQILTLNTKLLNTEVVVASSSAYIKKDTNIHWDFMIRRTLLGVWIVWIYLYGFQQILQKHFT